MIVRLPTDSVMVSDSQAQDIPEMPMIISNYENGDGISITGSDGESVYFSYGMVPDIIKTIQTFVKTKKKKK